MIKSKRTRVILLVVIIGAIGISLFFIFGIHRANNISESTNSEFRSDKEPIINRFPKLKNLEKCYWKAGVIGKQQDIGPTPYWMKGFIFLDKDDFKKIQSQFKWTQQKNDWKPSVGTNILGAENFKWAFSQNFNDYIKTNDYVGNFYLDMNNGILYFDVQK